MKTYFSMALTAIILFFSASSANAFDLRTAIGGLANAVASDSTTAKTSPLGGEGGLSSVLSGVLGNLLSKDKLSVNDIVGTWDYVQPAVSFKSDNFLQQAGGAAAAGTIEQKLADYYKVAGMDKLSLTVNPDSTFTMKVRSINLSGKLSVIDNNESMANFTFNFQVAGLLKIGKMDAYVVKSGNSLKLMFDVSKLVTLVKTVAGISGNATIKSISSLLESYDGICAGFTLNQSAQQQTPTRD